MIDRQGNQVIQILHAKCDMCINERDLTHEEAMQEVTECGCLYGGHLLVVSTRIVSDREVTNGGS